MTYEIIYEIKIKIKYEIKSEINSGDIIDMLFSNWKLQQNNYAAAMASAARRQVIRGGGGVPINKSRRRRPQIVSGRRTALIQSIVFWQINEKLASLQYQCNTIAWTFDLRQLPFQSSTLFGY